MTMIGMRSQHRVGHCSSSMDSFAAMMGPYFKSCEGCDYGNKPTDLSFQSRNVVEFSSPCAARSVCTGETFLHCILNLYHVIEISFSFDIH